MRIVCPSCSAAYDLPDGALSPGRAVRCARCGTQWAPLTAATAAPPSAPVQPLPMPVSTAEPSPGASPVLGLRAALAEDAAVDQPFPQDLRPAARRGDVLPIAAWIASLVLLAFLVGAAYAWRAQIMAAWPPSERLYAALGLTHPAGGAAPLPTRR